MRGVWGLGGFRGLWGFGCFRGGGGIREHIGGEFADGCFVVAGGGAAAAGLGVVAAHFHADGFGDAEFFHGDAVHDIGAAHGAFVMGDDDELAFLDEFIEHFEEAADVGFVEGGVEFVEDTERTGFDHVDGEEEGDGGHGAFAAGEEGDAGGFFAWGFGDDLDAAFERVVFVDEDEVGLAALAEEFLEGAAEVVADLDEGFDEAFFGFVVDALDDAEEFGFGVGEVVVFALEEVVAFFEFLEFLDGVEVDWAHAVEALFEVGDGGFDEVPVNVGGEDFVRGRGVGFGAGRGWGIGVLEAGGGEGGLGDGLVVGVWFVVGGRAGVRVLTAGGWSGAGSFETVDGGDEGWEGGFEGCEVDLIALRGVGVETFHAEGDLGDADLFAAALFGEGVDLAAGGVEGAFAFGEGGGAGGAFFRATFDLVSEFGDEGTGGGDFLVEPGVFCVGVGDAFLVGDDFVFAALDDVEEFAEPGVHGGALFAEGLFGALFDGEGSFEFAEEFIGVGLVAGGGVHGGFVAGGFVAVGLKGVGGVGETAGGVFEFEGDGVLAFG